MKDNKVNASAVQVLKLLCAYYLGLLPFIPNKHLGGWDQPIHKFSFQYLTDDLIVEKMEDIKTKDREHKRIKILEYYLKAVLFTINPLLRHLQRRGVHTCIEAGGSPEEVQRAIGEHGDCLDSISTPSLLNNLQPYKTSEKLE